MRVASGHGSEAPRRRQGVLAEIMGGEVWERRRPRFLITLRTKGETVEELVGLARTMRPLRVPVEDRE